jgi:hypothetical protein
MSYVCDQHLIVELRSNALGNGRKSVMSRSKARNYRALAAECERQAELAFEEPHFREMQTRLAKSYAALADAEDWLDGADVRVRHMRAA